MPADEIGMQMRFNDVLDLQSVCARFVQVDADVALRIDHAGHALRTEHVGSVRQARQIELLEIHTSSQFSWAGN